MSQNDRSAELGEWVEEMKKAYNTFKITEDFDRMEGVLFQLREKNCDAAADYLEHSNGLLHQ